ncbi:neuronal acetylcholine receptor subunit alpha-10-like [Lytechinus variegatus]|uniref:neuronal acetylcholine receptor subunit alpha-10-like n=1 Tax=Lytechinus variegatus TaxID=7654 RepID=UPI001BB16F7B|nr:neuronal acetylcholine receptor subunit alpha-10-like [Lytechinus variegatus]
MMTANFTLFLLLLGASIHASNGRNNRSILLQHLLDNYGPITVRPVSDVSRPTNVSFRLLPVELIKFDEENQQVKLSAYMRMIWRDENMMWDPMDFNGVDYVTVKRSDVWLPDIVLYQNVVKEFISYADTYIVASSNGSMNWYFPAIIATACPIDITYFPYDVQYCNLTFGPWSETADKVNFRMSTEADANVDIFRKNGVWVLEQTTASNLVIESCCFNLSWSAVQFVLEIHRQSSFYTRTVVVPCILLTALMALVCWLHPASGEKVTLAVSNLLALILFQQLVADRLPPSGETTSIIVIFFIVMIGLSCTEVICSIIVLRLYHTGGRRQIPDWIRRAMLSPLIMRLYTNAECTAMLRAQKKANELRILDSMTNPTLQNSANVAAQNQENGKHDTKADDIVKTISKPQELDTLSIRSDPEMINKAWQEVAIVCDKFLFILLLFVTFVAWLYVLISFLI